MRSLEIAGSKVRTVTCWCHQGLEHFYFSTLPFLMCCQWLYLQPQDQYNSFTHCLLMWQPGWFLLLKYCWPGYLWYSADKLAGLKGPSSIIHISGNLEGCLEGWDCPLECPHIASSVWWYQRVRFLTWQLRVPKETIPKDRKWKLPVS